MLYYCYDWLLSDCWETNRMCGAAMGRKIYGQPKTCLEKPVKTCCQHLSFDVKCGDVTSLPSARPTPTWLTHLLLHASPMYGGIGTTTRTKGAHHSAGNASHPAEAMGLSCTVNDYYYCPRQDHCFSTPILLHHQHRP